MTSTLKTLFPGATLMSPQVVGRSGVPTVAWRSLFGRMKLIVSVPKVLAVELGFDMVPKKKSYAEAGYLEQTGELVIVNITQHPETTDRWTVQNRQGTFVISLTAPWIEGKLLESQKATGCQAETRHFSKTAALVMTLPDWAAPKRMGFQEAQHRGALAAADARARIPMPVIVNGLVRQGQTS